MTTTVKHPTRTKMYKALIAAGLDKDAALRAYNAHNNPEPEPEPVQADPVAELVAAGFTEDEARKILSDQPKAKKEPKQSKSSQEKGEALVAKAGLTFTKGRVYVTSQIVEAQVRVLKTGKPEVVKTSGAGRVDSVLIFRTDSGDAAVQNLAKPV